MSNRIVNGIPHLIKDTGSDPVCVRAEDRTTLQELIHNGISQRAGGFYRDLRIPDDKQIFLLNYRKSDIDFACNYLLAKPWLLAHALQPEAKHKAIAIEDRADMLKLLHTKMEWGRNSYSQSPLDHALRVLTWPGHNMPFRRQAAVRQKIESAVSSGILDSHPEGWRPQPDPQARLLLAVNHWRILIDLRESFIASVDDQGKTVQCQQFEKKQQMIDWLDKISGLDGQIQVLPWSSKMEMPRLALLGGLREWAKHLCCVADSEAAVQAEFDLEGGTWGWLEGKGAFCEPVRHRQQGDQQDRPYLRLQILMHQAGELVHPGFPGQYHRLGREAPAVELYRPVNPFASARSEKLPSES